MRPPIVLAFSLALFSAQPGIANAFWWWALDCSDSDVMNEVASRMKSYFNSRVILMDGSDTAKLLALYLRDVPSHIDVVSAVTVRSGNEYQECELIGHLIIDKHDANTIARLAADDPILRPKLETEEGRSLFSTFLGITAGGFYGRVEYRISPNADGSINAEVLSVLPHSP